MLKIFKIVDPDNEKKVLKEYILEFFEISGFQIISKLCQEQMELEEMIKYTSSVVQIGEEEDVPTDLTTYDQTMIGSGLTKDAASGSPSPILVTTDDTNSDSGTSADSS